MPSYSNDSWKLIAALLVGGPTAVFYGLRRLNEKRLLQNTPCSKVRSAAIGMVELQGSAQPVSLALKAPVSGLDCSWWHCKVLELRSNGRESFWQTVQEMDSNGPFYLQDETGKVLVNPTGAELRVLRTESEVNSATRSLLSPVLQGWGIDDLQWFSLGTRLKIIEEMIGDGAPVFVMGELIPLAESPSARQERLHAYINAAKADPARMAAADANHDGQVDGEEWDAFRSALEQEFAELEMKQQSQNPSQDTTLVRAPTEGNFIIATESPQDVVESLNWSVPLTLLGGVAATAFGAWLALLSQWPAAVIAGLVGVGFVVSLFFKKGEQSWFWSL